MCKWFFIIFIISLSVIRGYKILDLYKLSRNMNWLNGCALIWHWHGYRFDHQKGNFSIVIWEGISRLGEFHYVFLILIRWLHDMLDDHDTLPVIFAWVSSCFWKFPKPEFLRVSENFQKTVWRRRLTCQATHVPKPNFRFSLWTVWRVVCVPPGDATWLGQLFRLRAFCYFVLLELGPCLKI